MTQPEFDKKFADLVAIFGDRGPEHSAVWFRMFSELPHPLWSHIVDKILHDWQFSSWPSPGYASRIKQEILDNTPKPQPREIDQHCAELDILTRIDALPKKNKATLRQEAESSLPPPPTPLDGPEDLRTSLARVSRSIALRKRMIELYKERYQ